MVSFYVTNQNGRPSIKRTKKKEEEEFQTMKIAKSPIAIRTRPKHQRRSLSSSSNEERAINKNYPLQKKKSTKKKNPPINKSSADLLPSRQKK